jgi:hypothetical protein
LAPSIAKWSSASAAAAAGGQHVVVVVVVELGDVAKERFRGQLVRDPLLVDHVDEPIGGR